MLETQLKRNRKGNPSFYHTLSYLTSMTPPCGHNSHHFPVLHTSHIMNIEWDYNYQLWSDNEWLVNKMLAMLDKDITM